MTEAFLHYVWKFRLFDQRNLVLTNGQPVEVLHPGQHNTDAGPDFFNARIKVGGILWAGNVEIHIQQKDWKKHGHNGDEAYSNVILHVVHEVSDQSSPDIPTLQLKELIAPSLIKRFQHFSNSGQPLPCASDLKTVKPITIKGWMERLLVERLESKTDHVLNLFKLSGQSWEGTFYLLLARNFGFKINSLPFELLAKATPLTIISRIRDDLRKTEALLFGQAGLLGEAEGDIHYNRLKQDYEFLRHRYRLSPLSRSVWKFLRLRPSNFPTIRIAQFAKLLSENENLFSSVIYGTRQELQQIFFVSHSEYWNDHYVFNRPAEHSIKQMGRSSFENILINTVAPVYFSYGKIRNNDLYRDKALHILTDTMPENNSIISHWMGAGLSASNGFESQALLQLKSEYCVRKRCLECRIGQELLKGSLT
jgi:hypothetical protein